MSNFLNYLISSWRNAKDTALTPAELEKQQHRNRFNWESEAISVCKQKYNFYKSKGNTRKADIYKRKILAKRPIISKLRNLVT